MIVKLEDIKKVLEEYFGIQARFRAPYCDRKSGKYCHKLVISGRENIKKFFRQGLTSYRTDHQQIIKELKKGQWCNDLIYDLGYALNEIKRRSEILFEKNYKEQFIVLTFKIRSPSPLKYLYYVTCYTQITDPVELDKAIEVFREVFRGEKLVHFRVRIDYKWKETKIDLKSIDEVIRKLNELGEEYENKIAEKTARRAKTHANNTDRRPSNGNNDIQRQQPNFRHRHNRRLLPNRTRNIRIPKRKPKTNSQNTRLHNRTARSHGKRARDKKLLYRRRTPNSRSKNRTLRNTKNSEQEIGKVKRPGRDLNPGLRLDRPVYSSGLYDRGC